MDPETPNPVPPSPPPPPPFTPSLPPPLTPNVPPRAYPQPGMTNRPGQAGRSRGLKVAVVVLSVLLAMSVFGHLIQGFISALTTPTTAGDSRLLEVMIENNHSASKIAVIPVEGLISSAGIEGSGYSTVSLIEDQLKLAGRDERVKAVLLKVNSPGGEVLASDDIYRAIEKFQDEYDKPVVASMGSLAASGGYYVSAPCRWIVANELTITGSIGVIMQTYNYRGLMNKVGLRPMVFKSGKFKDMLSGDKELENPSPDAKAINDEEQAMVQKMVNETFQRFKTVVETGRKKANQDNASNPGGASGRKLRGDWADFADGRILSGKEAQELGLVDETGNWLAAVKRTKILAGESEVNLVTYQPPFNLGNLFRLFGKSNAGQIKVDLGFDLPRLQAGLYFLAPSYLN
ncbi:MAG TPA: signal peptide peptidase SppA [Verrucomicrobiae bacterium]|nr:signal peptide peptidase SppA [Verrucomicrobiae bacterium]